MFVSKGGREGESRHRVLGVFSYISPFNLISLSNQNTSGETLKKNEISFSSPLPWVLQR